MDIFFIGAGNLANVLAESFLNAGHNLTGVYSRTKKNTLSFAKKYNCIPFSDIEQIPKSDIILIAVSDKAIAKIASLIRTDNEIVVHTSGSTSIDIFANHHTKYGVFYPLQTFTANRQISLSGTPVCIEASDISSLNTIKTLAATVSDVVIDMNSEKRKYLHLAAVFASNFTNHILSMSYQICNKNNIDFSLLYPLVKETVNKAFETDPVSAQTGPAKRYDTNIIEKHINMLSDMPNLKKMYTFVTESIFTTYNKK